MRGWMPPYWRWRGEAAARPAARRANSIVDGQIQNYRPPDLTQSEVHGTVLGVDRTRDFHDAAHQPDMRPPTAGAD
jgi:hypothetical protein